MNQKTLLVATLNLYLDPHFHVDERFCRVWRETWRFIPLGDRRRIIAYWRHNPPNVRIDDEGEDWTTGDSGNAAAQTRFLGRELAFRLLAVQGLNEDDLSKLIAHELAHVRLLADDPIHMTDPVRAHEEVEYLLDWWCLL